MSDSLIDDLSWRGLLYDQTEGAGAYLAENKVKGYVGFDPTADSLHVGNLLPILNLVRLQQHGHAPIALVGGATGMIGDPSGKSQERNLLSEDILRRNQENIRDQLARFLDFEVKSNPAILVNNADWMQPFGFIEFMRDVGKNFPVSYMLSKESVKRRINNEGISYTEFSYMLLQAYDFYHLYREHGCRLQMGGSDQWGNITAGIELIRRMAEDKTHGIVSPLITNSSGEKFGKTADGAVWLSAERTSPYKFYQFWLNTPDEDAIRYLKYFTLLDQTAIAEAEQALAEAPHKRDAQRLLAREVTRHVHGPTELDRAEKASQAMFGGSIENLSARDIADVFEDIPSTEIAKSRLSGEGEPLVGLFAESGLSSSKGDARRLIKGGGGYVNNARIEDPNESLTLDSAIEGQFVVLRQGRRKYHLLKILDA